MFTPPRKGLHGHNDASKASTDFGVTPAARDGKALALILHSPDARQRERGLSFRVKGGGRECEELLRLIRLIPSNITRGGARASHSERAARARVYKAKKAI